jgi:type IV secretory pathway ATPase VirB11/archaellum biosynthesis ATPase
MDAPRSYRRLGHFAQLLRGGERPEAGDLASRLAPWWGAIILGELRGAEAFTFLRAINTGHPGSLTTIHADSPARAVEQLALLVLQSGTQLRNEDIVSYVERAVDVFVQLERREGRRWVSQVSWSGVGDPA